MKLLTISNLYPRPGKPQRGMFNLQLFSAFAKSGHKVANICPVSCVNPLKFSEIRKWSDPAGSGLMTKYLPYLHIPVMGRNRVWQRCLAAIRQDLESIRRFAPDVIYASWLYPDGVAAARLGAELNVPVWIMVLGSDVFHLKSRFRRRMILDACRRAEGVICVAQHLKDALVEAGAKAETIHVVPNGVDTKVFSPVENFSDKCNRTSLKSFAGREVTGEKDETGNRRPEEGRRSLLRVSRFQLRQGFEGRDEGQAEDGTQQPATNNQQLAAHGCLSTVLWVGNMVEVKDPEAMLDVWEIALQCRARTKVDPLWRKERGQRSEVGGQKTEDCRPGGGDALRQAQGREDRSQRIEDSVDMPEPAVTPCSMPYAPCGCRLVFIGDGPLRRRLEQRVVKMGMGDSVEFAGSLPQEEVAEWMRKARALCLTSRSEGMPNVVLEALACGLPVVASDVGAIKHMLADCTACRVISLGEDFVRNFARALEEICSTTIDRHAVSQACPARSWADVAAEIIKLTGV